MNHPEAGEVAKDLDGQSVERIYRLWAPFYDATCGSLFQQARRVAAEAACEGGGRILEIGIGTGLSMRHYQRPGVELFGIDLCSSMLERARRRLASGRYPHVRRLDVMDAHHLRFGDGSFDAVVAQFTITLVACPERVLDECVRVVKPGGTVLVVSHFASEEGLAAQLWQRAGTQLHRFGLRPEFPLARLVRWTGENGCVERVGTRKVGLLGSYTLVEFRRRSTEDGCF